MLVQHPYPWQQVDPKPSRLRAQPWWNVSAPWIIHALTQCTPRDTEPARICQDIQLFYSLHRHKLQIWQMRVSSFTLASLSCGLTTAMTSRDPTLINIFILFEKYLIFLNVLIKILMHYTAALINKFVPVFRAWSFLNNRTFFCMARLPSEKIRNYIWKRMFDLLWHWIFVSAWFSLLNAIKAVVAVIRIEQRVQRSFSCFLQKKTVNIFRHKCLP